MGHAIVSKLAMLGDLCSCSLSTGGVIQAAGRCCGAYSFVCMYVCMFLFCFVLCYYAILTRQFTVSFFCLVPVHSLSGLIWKQDSSHLLKIF